MLRMIIADDEDIVREGLRTIVPWEEFGIEVIAEALDGQEALDLCRELKPDILFTDIRMPIMDGLEVAMELKENNSDIKIIIISGVQDFNYAKTALKINAEGYILKPVKIPELKETIQKVVDGIKSEQNRRYELQHLHSQLHQNLPTIREKFIRNWIMGIYKSEKEISSSLDYFSIPIRAGEPSLVAVLQLDDYFKVQKEMSVNDRHLLFFSISNIMEEVLNNHQAGVCSNLNENEFVAVFNQSTLLNNNYMQICEEISTCINKYLNVQVSIGVGRIVSGVLHLNTSYRDAVIAMQYSFYTGKNSLLDISDINHINQEESSRQDVKYSELYEIENLIMTAMKLGNVENVEKHVDELFDHIQTLKNLPADYVQNICFEMIYVAARAIYELNENIDHIVSNRSEIFETIYQYKSIFDLHNHMKDVFSSIAAYFSRKYSQKNTKVINKIKDIIEKRYMESIGIPTIAEEVYLSPNYISLIFKQETGETITEYITKVRMETAKELLKSSSQKILEIAESVGFENAHYFSTVFKKYTGIHPQKFRANTNTGDTGEI